MIRAYDRFNPIVTALFLISALIAAMLTMNIISLILCACLSAAAALCVTEMRVFLKRLLWLLPMLLLIAFLNPLFSKSGLSVLFYFNDRPITAEALLHGAAVALLLFTVLMWSLYAHSALNCDKTLYLAGRLSPGCATTLALAMRFIPRLTRQYEDINETQRALSGNAPLTKKLNALVAFALEDAATVSIAMRARGYGLRNKTSFALYRFTKKDAAAACTIVLITAMLFLTRPEFVYYPRVTVPSFEMYFVFEALLLALPAIIEVKEALIWKYCQSKI